MKTNLFCLVLLLVYSSVVGAETTENQCSVSNVVGISLPTKEGSVLKIGNAQVSRAFVYGQKGSIKKLVENLPYTDSLISDNKCELLLSSSVDVINAQTVKVPDNYKGLGCNALVFDIPDIHEFSNVYLSLVSLHGSGNGLCPFEHEKAAGHCSGRLLGSA